MSLMLGPAALAQLLVLQTCFGQAERCQPVSLPSLDARLCRLLELQLARDLANLGLAAHASELGRSFGITRAQNLQLGRLGVHELAQTLRLGFEVRLGASSEI